MCVWDILGVSFGTTAGLELSVRGHYTHSACDAALLHVIPSQADTGHLSFAGIWYVSDAIQASFYIGPKYE